jgi:Zn-finger protein
MDEKLGKDYKGVWDCSDCTLFHKKDVVERLYAIAHNLPRRKATAGSEDSGCNQPSP